MIKRTAVERVEGKLKRAATKALGGVICDLWVHPSVVCESINVLREELRKEAEALMKSLKTTVSEREVFADQQREVKRLEDYAKSLEKRVKELEEHLSSVRSALDPEGDEDVY